MDDRPSLAELTPGAVFAQRFRVLDKLSDGGMGSVYRAEQLSNGRVRALKLMHPQFARDQRFVARFDLEARIGARIASAHVVEVSDAGIDEATHTPWLAMELLQGRTLDAHLASRHLSSTEAWAILAQLGDALGAAHSAGVIHLDLKPENVFLADIAMHGVTGPVVKVLDFGIARALLEGRTSTEVTSFAGSPLWMSPEQANEGDRARASSDVWAFGLITFRMLTGRQYWRETKLRPLLMELLYKPLDPAVARAVEYGVGDRLPAGFDLWFRHCVHRDPEQRFQDARAAVTALHRTLFAPAMGSTVALDAIPKPPVDLEVAVRAQRPLDAARGTMAIPPTVVHAAAQIDGGDLQGARAALAQYLAGDASSAEVWSLRGECDLQLGRWDDAVTDFSAAIERAPSVGAYWYGRSLALAARGDHPMARADLAQAASLGHPDAIARAATHAAAG